jgi:hypothetical protein
MAFAMLLLCIAPQPAAAQQPLVPLSELQRDVRSAADARTADLADIGRVLSLPAAQKALRSAKVSPEQVSRAIGTLDDNELSRLADRARAAEKDVEGGLIVGLLALIGLIVVIIIVVSVVSD